MGDRNIHQVAWTAHFDFRANPRLRHLTLDSYRIGLARLEDWVVPVVCSITSSLLEEFVLRHCDYRDSDSLRCRSASLTLDAALVRAKNLRRVSMTYEAVGCWNISTTKEAKMRLIREFYRSSLPQCRALGVVHVEDPERN